jgi:hypothetical protein
MSLDSQDMIEALVSHAAATGHFERVNAHEPKNAPGNGLTCAVWSQSIGGSRSSGLRSTSAIVNFFVRIYTSMTYEPQDMIDPNIMNAVDELFAAYSGDFTLDGMVRQVDLLGAHSGGLVANAGYVEIDKKLYRCYTITVPVIKNDVWEQNP